MGWNRQKSTLLIGAIMLGLGTLSSLGFGPLASIQILGMDFLDFFDFLTNSIMMPIAAICTCLLVLRVVTIPRLSKEIERSSQFKRKKIFIFILKYLAIPFLLIILASSVLDVLGIIHM